MARALGALVVAAFCAVATSQVQAKNCDDDSIQEVSESGEIVIMISGHVYEVLAGDTVDAALWLPADDVLICETTLIYKGKAYLLYEIINPDESGEKVAARKLR